MLSESSFPPSDSFRNTLLLLLETVILLKRFDFFLSTGLKKKKKRNISLKKNYSLLSIISWPISSIVKIFPLFTANMVKHIVAIVNVETMKIEYVYSRKLLVSNMRNNQNCTVPQILISSTSKKFLFIKLWFEYMPIIDKYVWSGWRAFIFSFYFITEKWQNLKYSNLNL